MAPPQVLVVTEPATAACVAAALAQNHPVRVPGDLATAAEMLACGEASAPAMAVLSRHGARAVTLPEAVLAHAPHLLYAQGGPATTASGAAGLAGLVQLLSDSQAARAFGLGASSRVLILVTEADLDGRCDQRGAGCFSSSPGSG
jgi:diaminopropionate ammonia-lyase